MAEKSKLVRRAITEEVFESPEIDTEIDDADEVEKQDDDADEAESKPARSRRRQ